MSGKSQLSAATTTPPASAVQMTAVRLHLTAIARLRRQGIARLRLARGFGVVLGRRRRGGDAGPLGRRLFTVLRLAVLLMPARHNGDHSRE